MFFASRYFTARYFEARYFQPTAGPGGVPAPPTVTSPRLPSGRMWVNDVDVSLVGLMMSNPQGFLSAPGASHKLVPVPGRAGHLRVARESEIGPRRFTVEGVILAYTDAAAKALWDRAVLLLADEQVEVRFAAWPEMVGLATYEAIDWIEVAGFSKAAKVRLTFLMPNPHKIATQEDVYTIPNGQEVPIELGSAPCDLRLRLIGTGASNPTVLYRDAQGRVAGDISFNTPLPVGTWIDFDGAFQTSEAHSTTGVVSNASPFVDQSSSYIVLDPHDGDDVQGPTLMALNCSVVAYVRKAWR